MLPDGLVIWSYATLQCVLSNKQSVSVVSDFVTVSVSLDGLIIWSSVSLSRSLSACSAPFDFLAACVLPDFLLIWSDVLLHLCRPSTTPCAPVYSS